MAGLVPPIATTLPWLGTMDISARADAEPGTELDRVGASPNNLISTSTPNRSNHQKQTSWSKVVHGGRHCPGTLNSQPHPQLASRFSVLAEDVSALPTATDMVPLLSGPDSTPSAAAVSPSPPADFARINHLPSPSPVIKSSSSSRRRLLKEAVYRRSSGGLTHTKPMGSPSPVGTLLHWRLVPSLSPMTWGLIVPMMLWLVSPLVPPGGTRLLLEMMSGRSWRLASLLGGGGG